MRKIMLVYNPKAGRSLFQQSLPAVIDIFAKEGYRVEVWPTQSPGDAVEKVAVYGPEADVIVAAGGDGTLDETIEGMFRGRFKRPLGYIPVGSMNDFAGSIGLTANARTAARRIARGSIKPLDIGRFGNDHFVYVAAFGAFTDVAYKTSQDMKNALGKVAYMVEASRRLLDLKPVHMSITANGLTVTDDFIYGMVSNSTSVGGIKHITGKDVALDDGLFEVTLVHNPKTIFDLQEIVGALLSAEPSPLVDTIKTGSITFEADEDVPWTLDGEYGGSEKHVEISVLPHAINLILSEEEVGKAVDEALLEDS